MISIHREAELGFSAQADAYARGRPDYPPQVVEWLRAALALGPDKTALDLGAGTGKFLACLKATGARLIAVEPVAAMREHLLAAHPDVRALEGTAQAIPLPDASVDAVVCAQAFHWFATSDALAEINRVLKPGGCLGLVWNVRDESLSWVAEITRIIAPYEGDAPRYHTGQWRRLFPAQGFGPLQGSRFTWRHSGDPERVIVDRTLSTSFIGALPSQEREKVATALRALIAATPELTGREEVAYPYATDVFVCRKVA